MARRLLGRALRGALRLAVALGLLAVLWHFADGPAALRRLASAEAAWLVAALGLLTLQTVLSALRWRLTAAQLGIRIGRGTALREYYLSQIVNQTLPGGMLGDAGRAVRGRAQAGLMASGQAVAFDRLAGQLALVAVMLAGVLLTCVVPAGGQRPAWVGQVAAGMLAAGACVPLAALGLRRLLPARAAGILAAQRAALLRALADPAIRGRQIAFSLGTATCNVAAFATCAAALGIVLPLPDALALIPLILFAMLVPLTVSGWGVREGAAAALLPLAGATASEGLATSVAFGLVFAAAALPGALVVATGTRAPAMKS